MLLVNHSPKVSVYLFNYNESDIIESTVRHYAALSGVVEINLIDHHSTDQSPAIFRATCQAVGVSFNIYKFGIKNKIDEVVLAREKSNCQTRDKLGADYFIVADMDERVWYNGNDLINMQKQNILVPELYCLENLGLHRVVSLDNKAPNKCLMFHKSVNMVYQIGAHHSNVKGTKVEGSDMHFTHHHWDRGWEVVAERYKRNLLRMQQAQLAKGMSFHYKYTPEQIKAQYEGMEYIWESKFKKDND